MKDLEVKIEFLSKQNIKLCEQMENEEEILSQHEAYISLLENKNQQLKELLEECRNKIEEVMYILSKSPSIERNVTAHSILRKFMFDIDNAIGEKK